MRDYELTVILKGELTEKELEKTVKDFQALLLKTGAEMKAKKDAEKKSLAYEIANQREGYYLFYDLEIAPAATRGLEDKLKGSENIIRYLLVGK